MPGFGKCYFIHFVAAYTVDPIRASGVSFDAGAVYPG